VTTCAGDVAPLFEWIERAGHERVWLAGGGDLAGQALAVGRVDEVIVTIRRRARRRTGALRRG
jgi:dihydrofolate reductase